MERAQKEAKVAALREGFSSAQAVIVTHAQGMTVAESTTLRRSMGAAGASFRVTKNRLAKIALKGTAFEGLDSLFTGPTAVAFSDDPVAVAKAVIDFAKKNDKLSVVGGGLGGQVIDPAGVEQLTKLPSIDELRGKILGLIQAPATQIVTIMTAPAEKLARVVPAPHSKLVGVFRAYGAQSEAA